MRSEISRLQDELLQAKATAAVTSSIAPRSLGQDLAAAAAEAAEKAAAPAEPAAE